jgi:TPR repeat protein
MPLSEWKKFQAVKMPLAKWNKLIADLTAKAETDDAQAQWELGSLLDGGLLDRQSKSFAVKPNQRAAIFWFRRSAQAGNASGQVWLGNYLAAGRATKRDEDEAILWYKRAVRQSDSSAAVNIACVYNDRQDQRRAFFWYQRAAAMDDGDALVEVGIRYYEGRGVTRNPKRAVSCFRQAIQSGNISQAGREMAMFGLGRAYREGRGVRQSNDKAMEWLSKANVDDDIPVARRLINEIRREDGLDSAR